MTQLGIVGKTKLLKDQTTKALLGGSCTAPPRTGDPNIPPASGAVNPKAVAAALTGNAACSAPVDDPNSAAAWPLNGKITFTMTQTYTDMVKLTVKPYQIQADISLLGTGSGGPDTVDVGGIVLKGLGAGAIVKGDLWQDPVTLTGGNTGYNTGYTLDLVGAAGCADATPGNASITNTMFGGGSASSASLIGSVANGLEFTLGE